jgi:hypothetical protein
MFRIMLFMCLIYGACFPPGMALAGPPAAKTGDGKVHGRVSAGGLYFHVGNNLSTRGDSRIDSLRESPRPKDRVMGIAIFNLSYSPEGSRVEYYLGSPTTEFGRQGGGMKYHSGAGELDLFLFYSFLSHAWKDPYLVDKSREETRKDRRGAKLTWDRIVGGPYRASFGVEHSDVRDDDIASRYASLRRKGTIYQMSFGRHINLSGGFDILPALEYERGAFEGDAQSYSKARLRLGIKRFSPAVIVDARVWADRTRYDERHPVFDKRKTGAGFGAFLMVTKPNVFASRDNYLMAMLFYGLENSNIAFFDTTAGAAFLAVGRKF